jgi:cytochrome c oxidase subunit II
VKIKFMWILTLVSFSSLKSNSIQAGESSTSVDLEKGKSLFQLCSSCHGNNAEGKQILGAPALQGLPAWYTATQLNKFKNGLRGKHHLDEAGLRMRPMAMTLTNETDIQNVSAYIASLYTTSSINTIQGNLDNGKSKYQICSSCHGNNAEGNQIMKTPPLLYSDDWYLVQQITNFQKGIRGGPPDGTVTSTDIEGKTMSQIVQSLTEQDVIDVVTYIKSLQ